MANLSNQWSEILGYVGFGGVILTLFIILGYSFKVLFIRKLSTKYEFIARYEMRYLKIISTIFSISFILLFFRLISQILGSVRGYEYVFVGFVSAGIGLMIGYALNQYFKVYYPFILEKKLSKIRFKPRKSPKTGKPMKLLDETEEDAHLTKEMMEHEEAFTYDYDVWIDEDTGYKLIERFNGALHALVCPNCNFRTMKDYREVIIQSPGVLTEGLLKKHFQCSYCGHEEVKEVKIASLSAEKALGTM